MPQDNIISTQPYNTVSEAKCSSEVLMDNKTITKKYNVIYSRCKIHITIE